MAEAEAWQHRFREETRTYSPDQSFTKKKRRAPAEDRHRTRKPKNKACTNSEPIEAQKCIWQRPRHTPRAKLWQTDNCMKHLVEQHQLAASQLISGDLISCGHAAYHSITAQPRM
ncbi:hypothetical protein Nepgr_008102 [Nepenthes gracilis]|uniref:Uncharacterized protein n=1 Tax=Nepenthes gracilis TaxID=150966 RepID=A0AAD3S846_NEPGR|nr:hypothetical protein Nepgr_008102 [Nepenthes gracilis]